MKLIVAAFTLAITVSLAGCANGYEKFYQSVPPPSTGFAPTSGEPQMSNGTMDIQATVLQMFQNGYGLIGVSDFTGPAQDRAGAIKQAKKVGASFIIVSQKFQNTVSGTLPITMPTSTTSYSSGTASAYGTGGYASGSYSGTTTTYGSQTTYIPFSVDRYEQAALFFAPMQRRGLGLFVAPLDDAQRREVGTNQAVRIIAVRNGSPVFLADILPGDYLTSIDGKPVYDAASVGTAFMQALGHQAQLVLLHNGQKISKSVTVPADEW